MSYTFDLRYNQMRNNDPGKKDELASMILYDLPSNDRKVCFILADRTHMRFNYGLLVDEIFHPERNMIVLYFTSCTVSLTGIHLDRLFAEFETNKPRMISCVDERYNQLQENNDPVVNQITVTKN